MKLRDGVQNCGPKMAASATVIRNIVISVTGVSDNCCVFVPEGVLVMKHECRNVQWTSLVT